MDSADFGKPLAFAHVFRRLEAVVRRGPHAADELPKMLTALASDTTNWRVPSPLFSATWSASALCAARSPVRSRSQHRHLRALLGSIAPTLPRSTPRPAGEPVVRSVTLPCTSPLRARPDAVPVSALFSPAISRRRTPQAQAAGVPPDSAGQVVGRLSVTAAATRLSVRCCWACAMGRAQSGNVAGSM